jgi:hypothetical protein
VHKRVRFATTAGATVLTFAAMSGSANADPVGDLSGGLTDTVGNLTNTVTGGAVRTSRPSSPSKSTSSRSTRQSGGGSDPSVGVGVDGPVHVAADLGAQSSAQGGTQAHAAVTTGLSTAPGAGDIAGASAQADLDTCGFLPEDCGQGAPPPTNPGPGPSAPPATPPVSGPQGAGPLGPSASSASIVKRTLPITGGPLGTLAGLGLAGVLTGAGAVAGSRFRERRGDA